MKVSLPDEAVTYDIANNLGEELRMKGEYDEAKVFFLAALEGGRLLVAEHKKTLDSLNAMWVILHHMKDNAGAHGYYQQALRVQEKVLGKMHPDTLGSIMNIGNMHMHRGFH